jgi:hypothetical protein
LTGKKKRQKGRTLVAQGGATRVDSIGEDGEVGPCIMELALASREENELYLVACFSWKKEKREERKKDCCCFASCVHDSRGTRIDGCTRSYCCLLLACSMQELEKG